MGLFQFLGKIMDHADDLKTLTENVKKMQENASQASVQKQNEPNHPVAEKQTGNRTPKDILQSASSPAKPSVRKEETFYDGDNEAVMQFMLSGDFVAFNSHAEPVATHQYEPFSNEAFTDYDGTLPCFMLSCEDVVYRAVEEFKKHGTVGTKCQPAGAGKMLFRAKLPYYDQVMVMYGFERGTSLQNFGMCMVYHHDVEGTPLEEKLLAALEEAAATYTEIKK